jgi:hypothetical protein
LRLCFAGSILCPQKTGSKFEPWKRKKETLNPINIMKKGKTFTVLVLVVEIASITILHAVKINQSEKAAAKEVSKSASEVAGSKPKTVYSLASFK